MSNILRTRTENIIVYHRNKSVIICIAASLVVHTTYINMIYESNCKRSSHNGGRIEPCHS